MLNPEQIHSIICAGFVSKGVKWVALLSYGRQVESVK